MSDVFEGLRARLDELAVGLPKTENKIEIRLLKRLFTEAQAEFFVQLHPLLEAPDDVANRLNRDPGEVADLMEQMAKKGLLFRKRDGDRVRYAAVPYVVGIFEFQVKSIDKELAKETEDYSKTILKRFTGVRFSHIRLRCYEPFRSIVKWWPTGRLHPTKMFYRLLKTRKKLQLLPASAEQPENWPTMIAINPWKTVFRSVPTLNIMLRTDWAVLSPKKKPSRSLSIMKKPVW
jgi:hypothetical protein